MHTELIAKFQSKAARIGIVGLGYVGLPLALRFSEVGYSVIGLDIATPKSRASLWGARVTSNTSTQAGLRRRLNVG